MNSTPESKNVIASDRGSHAIPKATALLPVFNAEKYLAEAIRSILVQTFKDFELLLIDDGSTDRSLTIIKDFADQDTRCVVVSRENRGLVRTLNEGVDSSRSDLILRMDADDRSHPSRFERQIRFLDTHPDYVAIGTDVLLIDPDGAPLRRFGLPTTHEEIDAQHMSGVGSLIVHPTVAFRKSAVLKAGKYREEFQHAEDFDLFLRLAEIGKVANLPDTLLEYRQHTQSIGYQHSQAQIAAKSRAVISATARRGPNDASLSAVSASDADPGLGAVYRKWAWWALASGNVSTARKHVLKAIRHSPCSLANLKLIACAIRGY